MEPSLNIRSEVTARKARIMPLGLWFYNFVCILVQVQADDHVVDWLHPLAECKFETLNNEVLIRNIHGPVLWNGDVYLIDIAKRRLLKYLVSNDSWKGFDQTLYSGLYAHSLLATYHSKLLLISENCKVWELDDNDSTFKPSPNITLPSSWAYHFDIVAAASEGDYLLLIRKGYHGEYHASVMIFDSKVWVIRDGPYLYSESDLQVFVHNRSVYLIEWPMTTTMRYETTSSEIHILNIYETSLQSLLDDESDPWQLLRSTLPLQSYSISTTNITMIGGHLALVSFDYSHVHVWHYFTSRESWLETGCFNIPSHTHRMLPDTKKRIVNLPDGSLMMMTGFESEVAGFGYMRSMQEPELTVYKLKPESEGQCNSTSLLISMCMHVGFRPGKLNSVYHHHPHRIIKISESPPQIPPPYVGKSKI